MPDETPAEKPESWESAGEGATAGALKHLLKLEWAKPAATFVAEVFGAMATVAFKLITPLGVGMARGIASAEDEVIPELAEIAAAAASDVFGSDIPASTFANKRDRGARTNASTQLGAGLLKTIKGQGGPLEPGEAGAERYLGMVVNMALEGWYQGFIFEYLSSIVPWIDIGKIESFGELDDTLAQSLGLGRLSRRVIGPVIDATVVTPLQWSVNKTYRPNLLATAAAVRQIVRHPDQREKWIEELRRAGWSDDRIEALINEQAKFHSVSDVYRLQRASVWSSDDAMRHLADQGYAANIAETELQLEKLRVIESFERSMATTAVDAFADGRIDETTLAGFCTGSTISDQEKAQYLELAHARRICSTRPLTPSEAAAAVRAGVLSFIDYRRALERDGRDDQAITVLELMLRADLDKQKDIEEHRRELEAQRAAEKAARERVALERKAAADAKLALARRGSVSDLEAAYIRGLIPLDRVRELYAATYDGDTAAVLSELLESRRVEYVDRQEAAEKAKTRATARGVNVGELETAVVTGVLTLDQFRRRLDDLHFEADDADLLTATLRAKLAARDDAERKRDAAAAAAKIRHVDLATIELLVRRGHRSLADYAALLRSLNFDDGAVAAIVERLQIQIDDDAAAAATRQAAAAKLAQRGLSLEQFRRAVLLDLKTVNEFATFVLDQKFTADAIAVLVAELQTDVDEAAAARRRREDAERRSQAGSAPLSSVRRAARLGLIPVAAYAGRLAAAGYTDDDIALELDLLATERADDAARAAAAETADAASPDRGLTLGQLAAAVKAGTATIDQYRARALAIGLSAADAEILTDTLIETVQTLALARDRQQTLAGDAAPRELARADLERAVRKGVITLDDYAARLPGLGYTDDDAALLVAVLAATLGAPTDGEA